MILLKTILLFLTKMQTISPLVVPAYKYFSSFKENNNVYIVTEYINGGNLESIIKSNIQKNTYTDERKVWDLMIQCLSGLMYLHEKKNNS